jgi:hypothetical protein
MNTDEKCLMITMIAFLALMLYYYVYRPSYVMNMDIKKNENKNISIRKCLVYSMLWSSALGLLFLFVMMFYKNSENKNNNNNNNNNNKENKFSVEPPTFRS